MKGSQFFINSGTISDARRLEMEIFGNCSDEQDYITRKVKIMVVSYIDHIVSFLVTYVRDGRIYIWLCGTKDIVVDGMPIRRQGFLARMLKLVLPTYKEEGVWVKTYPDYFKDMYSWITKRGFVCECDEPTNKHPERGPFVRFGTTKKDLLSKL
jgi:hypothetical protein